MPDKKKFSPMHGLDLMTEDEKRRYYYDACEHYGVPPELNLLQFIWLENSEGNGKNLVLYARRGFTDVMRSNHGISVDEMKETVGDGFIMFTAKGHDKSGRTDVAVGSAFTRDKHGRAISDAIMTAQTRASRRLTLQFVGGGLLDESEVTGGSQTVSTVSEPLKNIIHIPTAHPNEAPGSDITEQVMGAITQTQIAAPIDALEAKAAAFFAAEAAAKAAPVVEEHVPATFAPVITRIEEKIADLHSEEPVKKKRRRRSTAVVLETPGLKIEESDNVPCDMTPALNVGKVDFTPAQLEACEALKRSLPKLKEVSAEDDEIIQMEAALAAAKAKKRTDALKAKKAAAPTEPVFYPEVATFTLPTVVAPAASVTMVAGGPPLVIKDLPKDVQMKEFKNRLFAYTNDILPKGGMKGSEGIGGVEYKIKAFVSLMFPQTQEVKHLTVNQWEIFLGYMDEKLAELGQPGLVALIDQKLGVKA